MKIYDMVEGKWITEKKTEKEKKAKLPENPEVRTRLITYEEDKTNRSRRSSNGQQDTSSSF